jgi:Tol biopolymer transport system component
MADAFIGRQLNGYEILAEIGRGGMATVYRARQLSVGRIVAFKALPLHLAADSTYLQRFEREARIISKLEHRSIVPVYDYGQIDSQPYIVMRYMAGGSVDERLHGGPLPADEVLRILEQIAPALDYAHGKDVLHRDIKPSNVLLDESGGAFLTDFGIARVLSEGTAGALTTHGVVGTPSYMSPEQAQGKPLDGRSDIYSLGVMLFELLTGRRPFEADTPYGIAVAHVTEPPPTPRSLNPAILPAIEQVVLTTLRKKRDERYPSAAALVEALRHALLNPDEASAETTPVYATAYAVDATVPVAAQPPLPPAGAQQDMQPFLQPVYTPSTVPPIPGVPYSGSSIRQPRVRGRSPRLNSLWISAALGGLIGCALFTFIAVFALLVLSAGADTAPPTPTAAPASPAAALTSRTPSRTPLPLASTNTPAPDAPVPETSAPTPAPLIIDGAPAQGRILFAAERSGSFDIYLMDLATRTETRLTENPADDVDPAPAPDGQTIVFASDRDGDYELYTMNLDGGEVRQLTSNGYDDLMPSFSPNGTWIVYAADSDSDGLFDLYRVFPNGDSNQRLYSGPQRNADPHWQSADNAVYFSAGAPRDASTWEIRRLDLDSGTAETLTSNRVRDRGPTRGVDDAILYETEGDGGSALALLNPPGGQTALVYDGPGFDYAPALSPDGRLIVFTSDASGRDELYLISANGEDPKQITEAGGTGAAWIPGG